ncbi:g6057 [Coccomyxa elongata]
MYVREAYIELQKVLRSLEERGIGHVNISGNPGLGKSWFATCSWPKSFSVFHEGTVSILSEEDAVQMLYSGKTNKLRYIADGVAPLIPNVQVVQSLVAHSPDESVEYMKPRGHLAAPLYMPFWEIDELKAVRPKLFPKISHDQMLQLIAKRGEVPHYVLDKADQRLMDNSIDTAIESLKVEDIIAAAPGTTSHRIAKIHPPHWRDGNFGDYKLSFLSPFIKEKCMPLVWILPSFFFFLQLASDLGACLNESLTHPHLKAGGAWEKSGSKARDSASSMTTARGCESDTESSTSDSGTLLPRAEMLELPPLPTRYFWKAEDLSSLPCEDQYVQPQSASFEAVDSIAIVRNKAYLFQITQDTQHNIKAGLLDVLAYLPQQLEVEFVWVLPPSVWASQTFNRKDMPQKTSLGSPAAGRWALVEKRLRACQQQYKIPIPSEVPPRQPQSRVSLQCAIPASRKTIKKMTASGVTGLSMVRMSAPALCLIPPV